MDKKPDEYTIAELRELSDQQIEELQIVADSAGFSRRTTIFLTDVLNMNLDALSLTANKAKGFIVRVAISIYMVRQTEMHPFRRGTINISY